METSLAVITPTNPALRRLAGSWALVTGASDGIGQAFAEQLAAAGFDLVLVARRGDRLEALATTLRSRHGVQCRAIATDLGQATAVDSLADTLVSIEIGMLVAAAGFGTSGPFLSGARQEDLAMIDVNCRAVAELAHVFGARMAANGRGAIVLLSSLVAFQGVPRAANYAATKAYIQVLAEGLRVELKPQGVDVLSVAPGPVNSGFGARAGMTMGQAGTPATVARVALAVLGRSGTVRPGWLAKLLEGVLMLLPRRGRTAVMTKVMAGMTGA